MPTACAAATPFHGAQQDLQRLFERELPCAQQLGQRLAVEQLHHDVDQLAVLADVEHVDHVSVLDAPGRLRLAQKALDELRVLEVLGQQALEGQLFARDTVLDDVDGTHAAAADLSCDHVLLGDDRAGLRQTGLHPAEL